MKTKNIFRMLLVAVALLLGANNLKAETFVLWEKTSTDVIHQVIFQADELTSYNITKLRFYCGKENAQVLTADGSEALFASDWGNKYIYNGSQYQTDHYHDTYFEFDVDSDILAKMQSKGLLVKADHWQGLTKIEIDGTIIPSGPHAITIANDIVNGTVTADKTSAEVNETVTLTAVSAVGYKLKNIFINGNPSKFTMVSEQANADGTTTTVGTFAMTVGDATISAEFMDKNIIWEGSSGNVTIDKSYFNDVAPNCTLRVWAEKKVFEIKAVEGTILFNSQWQSVLMGNDLDTYYRENSYFEFILSEEQLAKIKVSGLYLCSNYSNSMITRVMLIDNNSSGSTKTNVTLTYSATTVSATTASIGETLANAPTLSSSVEGLTFTYESSNTSVAEVSTEGVVTIKGAGTTVIKAKFAGDDTYNSAEASYTLTITEATYSVTIGETTNGQISTSPTTDVTAGTTVTITATPSEGYKLSTITVTGADETNVELSGTGNTRTFTMPSQNVTVSATFAEIETIEATITSTTSFATFCSNKALDFTGINTIEAYYAKTVENGNVYLLRIYGTVKAGTGLVLKGATTRIPVAESGDELEGNMLIGVSADTDVNASTDYVLTEKNGVAVFAQTGVNKATVAAGHAYLRVPVAQARTRAIGIGGEGTTGIDNTFIDNCEQGEMVIYNLGGQRVKNAAKGLFIINGKKKILK